MNTTMIARILKIVALLGFLLPWVLVSCARSPLASLTGLDLVTGSVSVHNPVTGAMQHPNNGHPDSLAVLAVGLVIVGIVGGWLLRGRLAAMLMAATSAVALVVAGVCVGGISSKAQQLVAQGQHAQASSDSGDVSTGSAIANLIQVQVQYGFWITEAALLACALLCAAILMGVVAPIDRALGRPPPP